LLAVLEGKAQRWVLVGHSHGGLVVRVASASAPDLTMPARPQR
jgi:pimeloyl-ACP methyl ester carboxylesterase